jgi:hypothetical protein
VADAAKRMLASGSAHHLMHKIHAAVISGLVEQQSVDHSVGSQAAFYSVA